MLAAKFAAPYASRPGVRWPALERAADRPITLFTTPSGYLFANSLADRLTGQGRSLLWLRIGPEDRDPATFLLSLIESVRRLRPEFGASTLRQMQQAPGPIAGWPALYAHLAWELAESLPESSALVLEHAHILAESHPTLALLGGQLLARLSQSFPCIVVSHKPLPPDVFPAHSIVQGADELRVDAQVGLSLAASAGMALPGSSIQRALALLDGQAVPLTGIINACRVLGPEFIQRLVNRARNENQLLGMVAQAWLAAASAGDLQALALAMDLDYSHPEMTQAVLGIYTRPSGPWLQDLTDDWSRIWCLWKTPLRSALRRDPYPNVAAIMRTADYLLKEGAVETAIRLYLEAEDFGSAARVISETADKMLNLGQWSTLEQWLKRLPGEVLYSWPGLVYIQGEIRAGRGLTGEARRSFAVASRLFADRQDADGACKSLLAEGTLAAWEGERDRAQACALSANALAQTAGLNWHQAWANWALGCLAAAAGNLDEALNYFGQASNTIKEPLMAELFGQAEKLALRQRELHRQREFHRQAYLSLEQSEQDTLELLRGLIDSPPENLPDLLSNLGWLNTPLMLKLTKPPISPEEAGASENFGVWRKMLSLLGLYRPSSTPTADPEDNYFPALDLPLPVNDLDRGETPVASLTPLAQSRPAKTMPAQSLGSLSKSQSPETSSKTAQATSEHVKEPNEVQLLTAYTLGAFRLYVNDSPMQRWPSSRGLAVFKYLLFNHAQKTPREVLMDTFWRDSDPEAARNSLNVSLHSLRSSLREITEAPIVLFEKGDYFLNPDLQVWIDFKEFESHLQAGRQLEAAGELVMATNEYEVAASLYQGDFLEEDLYEEWPVLPRESLRIAYLDMLDRLSQIYFGQGRYAACVALCGQILERDNCREDAHCLLMRCYSRQGQQHLALRQYQACVEALRAELDVDPEPATVQLADRIRRRERV